MMKSFLKPLYLLPVLTLLAGLYLFSLWQREADIDDAWIGEHAYWLAEEGHAKSELMRGITGQEEYLIVHHKLLVLNGALFIKLFGFSLPSLKSVSLLYFILFLILFHVYFRRRKSAGMTTFIFSLILLFTFPWIFKYSFVFRPEIMLMTLTFASWMLLEGTLSSHSKSPARPLLAGILGGLCFAVHLNGIIVAVAGFILLLIYKRHRASLFFALGSMMGALVYFYDFNSTYGWEFWWFQLTESPALDSLPKVHPLLQPFLNLMNEHQRFFHNPQIIFSTVFIFFSLVTGFRRIVHEHKPLLWYTFLLAILLGLTAMHKSRQYLLIYFPFLVILIADTYMAYFSKQDSHVYFSKWRKHKITASLLVILLGVFIVSGFYYNLAYSLEKFSARDNEDITERFIHENPEDLNIVAPMTFIYNEIEHFARIQSEACYIELQKADPSIRGAGFLEHTRLFGIRYIILSDYYRILLGWEIPGQEVLPRGFEIISGEKDKYLVIKRM